MQDQLLANPGAMAYLLGNMGAAVSPQGSWGARLGAMAANMGGQMQQAKALGALLGGGGAATQPPAGSPPGGNNAALPGAAASIAPQPAVAGTSAGGGVGAASSLLNFNSGLMNPQALQAYAMLAAPWGGAQGFNVPPGLFSPVNALGADLPNVLKTGAVMAQAQDDLSGAKDLRSAMVRGAIEGPRLDAQERMALRKENLQLQLQQMRDQAADDRLDKRERAAAERQARQTEAMLAGIDKRISAGQGQLGQPVSGVDEAGTPAFFRFDKQGKMARVQGASPPTTAQDRLTVSGLTTMVNADLKLLDSVPHEDDRALIVERIRQNRARLDELLAAQNRPAVGMATPPAPATPTPPKKLTIEIAREYYRRAGGDPDKARAMAAQDGYK